MDAHSLQPPAASYQVLLEVAEAIAVHRDLGDLFHDLAGRLHGVVQFDYLNLILHDAKRNVMRLHTLEANRPTIIQPGLETPVEWSAAGHVLETQQPLVVPDVMQDERFPKMREILSQENIVSVLHFAAHDCTTPARLPGIWPGNRTRIHERGSGIHAAGGAAGCRGRG